MSAVLRQVRRYWAIAVAVGFCAGLFGLPMPKVEAKAAANLLSPANQSSNVPLNAQLVIKFDEVMKANAGKIDVFEVTIPVSSSTTAAQIKAGSKKVESIDVASGSLWTLDSSGQPVWPKVNMGDKRGDGTSLPRSDGSDPARWVRITINPLKSNTWYYILIDETAFTTASTGERFSIQTETTWMFSTGAGTTTVPGVTTTVPAAACPGITFPGRAPRQRIDAAQTQFSSKSLACSIGVITRSKLIAVAIASSGTIANPSVASYTVKATRIGGSFLTKPVPLVAGPSVQRTQFSPLKTGSWTITVTALGPTGAVVAEWTSAAFPVRP